MSKSSPSLHSPLPPSLSSSLPPSLIFTPTLSVPDPRETTVRENLAVLGALACLVLQGCQAKEEKR